MRALLGDARTTHSAEEHISRAVKTTIWAQHMGIIYDREGGTIWLYGNLRGFGRVGDPPTRPKPLY